MDIDNAATRGRPSFNGPTTNVVEQHRRALHQAIVNASAVTESSVESLPGPDRDTVALKPLRESGPVRTRRSVVAAAAALLVVAAIVPAAWYAQTRSSGTTYEAGAQTSAPSISVETPSVAEPVTPTTQLPTTTQQAVVVPVATHLCGEEALEALSVPEMYAGPVDGPSPDTAAPVRDGQLVRHWVADTGSAELRWPADPSYSRGTFMEDPISMEYPATEGLIDFVSTVNAVPGAWIALLLPEGQTTTPDGRSAKVLLANSLAPDQSGECAITQVTVFDDDPAQIDAAVHFIIAAIEDFFAPPLIVGTASVAEIPEVVACEGGGEAGETSRGAAVDVEIPPNVSEDVSGFGTYPTPAEALEVFVTDDEAPTKLPAGGYLEMAAPDGTVLYGIQFRPSSETQLKVTVLIQVVAADDGWTIASWEASGC